MSGRQDTLMPAPRRAYPQRGRARGLPLRGVARGALYQRGSPLGALAQRMGSGGALRQRGSPQYARRGHPFSPPPEEDQRTIWEIAMQLWGNVRTQKWWRGFWRHVPVRQQCAVCVGVRVGAWAVVALTAAEGACSAALLTVRAAHADAWAAVYDDRAALLAYLTALTATAALLLLPAVAVLVAGLVLRSHALVEGYLWTVVAHLVVDWLATGCMAAYCLAEPACLRGQGAGAPCRARSDGGGAAFLVTGAVLMLGYSVVWAHLLIAVNSYRHTFESMQ